MIWGIFVTAAAVAIISASVVLGIVAAAIALNWAVEKWELWK